VAFAKTEPKAIAKSTESFKVLYECPLIVMLLFQLYPRYVDSNIHALIPLMMKALNLKTSKPTESPGKAVYQDFIAAQVKTLSFLTYVLRGFSERMQRHQVCNRLTTCSLLCFVVSGAAFETQILLDINRNTLFS